MSALPQKIDPEQILQRMTPRPVTNRARSSRVTQPPEQSLRIVADDGLTVPLRLSPQAEKKAPTVEPPVDDGPAVGFKPTAAVQIDSTGQLASDTPILVAGQKPSDSERFQKVDAELAWIIDAWPRVPRSIQAAMLALIEVADQPCMKGLGARG